MNKLINETSPYLLQHAYNPVNWYPWGDEAFEKAAKENKPVFLSIGYSTCHWCHVMEQESFEDDEVAKVLNRDFVCIKVDKEERQDIDAVYMSVCIAQNGSGGWPLTVLLTPDQKPFYTGTYFPKHNRFGQIGLLEILENVMAVWKSEQDSLVKLGEKIINAVSGELKGGDSLPGQQALETAADMLQQSFDSKYGGFGISPKFPMPQNLMFLLRCHHLKIGKEPLEMVEKTLKGMYKGGIFDHIGGGFSRYSTDEKWLVPHFEKMLYDNALLVIVYLEAYQITKNPLYSFVADKTLEFITREMTSGPGGFYTALDADSKGEEGSFYTFDEEEIYSVLGEEGAEILARQYGITNEGNFEGKNVLNLFHCKDAPRPDQVMEKLLEKLYRYRRKRYVLHKDDKILTSWNAMMIVAFARAYAVLGDTGYLSTAKKAFSFIQNNLMTEDGRLLISLRKGIVSGKGLLDDYAFLCWSALELYEVTFDSSYLAAAVDLMRQVLKRFPSPSGGFYLSPDDGEALAFRPKEQYDNAVPSGNSAAAWCLVKLAILTGDKELREASESQLLFYSNIIRSQPTAVTFALCAYMQMAYPTKELICTARDIKIKEKIVKDLRDFYHPQLSILIKTPESEAILSQIAPYITEYPIPNNEIPVYYLCEGRRCMAPETDFNKIKRLL